MQPSTANVCYIHWHFCSFTCGHYYSKQTFVSLFSIFNVILRLWTSKFVTKAGERKNHQSLNLLHIKTWKNINSASYRVALSVIYFSMHFFYSATQEPLLSCTRLYPPLRANQTNFIIVQLNGHSYTLIDRLFDVSSGQ